MIAPVSPNRRTVMNMRALNIAMRTAHIGAMGVLLGGHAFDIPPERLRVSLWLTIGTGLVLRGTDVAVSTRQPVPAGALRRGTRTS